LIPIAFAALLSMLLLPVAEWLEKKGMGKVISIILAILVIVLFFAGVIWLISWQLSDIMKDSESINQNLTKKVTELRNYISSSLGISKPKQEEVMAKQQSEAGGSGIAGKILSGLGGFVTNLLLVLIYIFLFMFFRTHLKKFILQLVPRTDIPKTEEVITKCRTIAQKYITGLGMMIVCLWVMYGIGFSILAVPFLGIIKIICDNVQGLKPYGFVLGQEKEKKNK
jgi:predicted PurR-regulated permease PerM